MNSIDNSIANYIDEEIIYNAFDSIIKYDKRKKLRSQMAVIAASIVVIVSVGIIIKMITDNGGNKVFPQSNVSVNKSDQIVIIEKEIDLVKNMFFIPANSFVQLTYNEMLSYLGYEMDISKVMPGFVINDEGGGNLYHTSNTYGLIIHEWTVDNNRFVYENGTQSIIINIGQAQMVYKSENLDKSYVSGKSMTIAKNHDGNKYTIDWYDEERELCFYIITENMSENDMIRCVKYLSSDDRFVGNYTNNRDIVLEYSKENCLCKEASEERSEIINSDAFVSGLKGLLSKQN